MEKLLRKIGKTGLFLIFLNSFGLSAQTPVLSADDTRIAPGDPVTVTLATTLNGEGKIDYPLEFTPEYAVSEGMESVMDHKTGKVKTSYFVQQRGSFTKKGKYTFYAFIRYKGQNLKSNAITITVTDDVLDNTSGPRVNDPIYGIIQSSKTVVYEGEPVLMRAKVFSKLDIYHLEGYSPFHIDNNAEEHIFQSQLPNFQRSKENGKHILTLEFGSQLVFPVKTGKSRITPFEMSLLFHDKYIDKAISLKSSPAVITVKPLPNGTPADFIGAVGTYSLEQKLGKTSLAEGEVFELKLTVKGLGNLHNTNAPVLNLPNGCTVYGDPKREEDYIYTEEGVEGEITYTYNIAIAKTGKINFDPQSISFFDLSTKRYQTVETSAFEIEVKLTAGTNKNPAGVKPKPEKQKLVLLPKQEEISNAWIYILIGGLVVLLITILFLRKKPATTIQEEETGIPVVKAETISERDFWKELAETSDDSKIAELLPKAIIAEINKKTGKTFLSTSDTLRQTGNASGKLSEIIEACEHFKYAFGEKSLNGKELVSKARQLLNLR